MPDVYQLLYDGFLRRGSTDKRADSDARDIVAIIPEPFFENTIFLSSKLQRLIDVLTEVNNTILTTKDF